MAVHKITENGITKYLRTKVDSRVISLMVEEYKTVKDREKYSFQAFLTNHGIESVYDGTMCEFNIDELPIIDAEN